MTTSDLLDIYWDNPVWFCKDALRFTPDPWQDRAMMDVATSAKVTVRSGQGVGKTALEAALVIWFLCCRPYPKVICTAPTRQQLYDVLWAEIAKWLENSLVKELLQWQKTKVYMIGHEDRWFATAKTATRAANIQGFHEDHMLFLVDEASGVSDVILEAILGTLSGLENKLVMCGNPNTMSGIFYDSYNRDRASYRTHKVSSLDSPRTSRDNIEMLRRKYHEDSDVWRVRVLGEPPRVESNTFIPLEMAELAAEAEIEPVGDVIHIGCDVARFGGDETVIAPRIGDKCFDLQGYSKQDTMVTTGWVLATAREYMRLYPHIKEARLKIDDSGVGGGVTDRLREILYETGEPFEVVPVNNQSAANDEHYENVGTESWGILRDRLQESFSGFVQGKPRTIQLPQDDRLISQLTTRKYRMTSRGKVALEKKEDMKKRGLTSPDRADAVVLAFYEAGSAWMDYLKAEQEKLRGGKV